MPIPDQRILARQARELCCSFFFIATMAKVATSPSPGRKRTRKTDGKGTTPNKARKTSAPAPAANANGGGIAGFFRWGSNLGGAAASSDPPAPAGSGGRSGAAAFRAAAAATSPTAKKTKAQKRAEAERRAKEWAEKRKAKKGDKKEAAAPAPEDSDDDDEAAGVGAPAPKAAAPPKSRALILTRLVSLSFLLLSTLGLATLYSHERSLRILTETNLSRELRYLQAEVEAHKTKLVESEKARLADKRAAGEARKCSEDLRKERLERESSAVEFQKQIDACYADAANK